MRRYQEEVATAAAWFGLPLGEDVPVENREDSPRAVPEAVELFVRLEDAAPVEPSAEGQLAPRSDAAERRDLPCVERDRLELVASLNEEVSRPAVSGDVLLVAAAPCALAMSTPVAFAAGMLAAGRHGILIKGGRYLEVLGRVRTVAFDKTGTLTRGRPSPRNPGLSR